jgi:outer membrane biosynthesis protein TonB
MNRLLFVFGILMTVGIVQVDDARAGILLKTSRLRSSVNTSLPSVRVGNVKKSTAAASRLNPIKGSRSFGTPDSLAFLEKQQVKYQKKYAKWEKKRVKAEKKLAKKKEKKRKLEEKARQKKLKELAKQREKLKKEQAKAAAKIASQREQRAASEGGIASETGPDGKSDGKFGKREGDSNKKPPSFWSRFWVALVGRS